MNGDLGRPGGDVMKVWVTATNHAWASEVTGLSIEEVDRRYQDARVKKIICTIEVRVVP